MDQEGWSLTESDPGVFTGILHELGAKDLEVEELWGLDMLPELKSVHALIFLFKWVELPSGFVPAGIVETPTEPFYFARQVITNACGTLAILNSVLNIQDSSLALGSELENLKSFSQGLDYDTCGLTISNSEVIRSVHNSFARNDPFQLDEARPATKDDDVFHFIAYLPINGKLYELDGLKQGPISHGSFADQPKGWAGLAKKVVQSRIATYPEGSLHFNLQAITSRSRDLKREIAVLEQTASPTLGQLNEINECKDDLASIEARHKQWETENTFRRFNYTSMIHAIFKKMAETGKLSEQVEVAKKTMRDRVAAAREKGQPEEDIMDID